MISSTIISHPEYKELRELIKKELERIYRLDKNIFFEEYFYFDLIGDKAQSHLSPLLNRLHFMKKFIIGNNLSDEDMYRNGLGLEIPKQEITIQNKSYVSLLNKIFNLDSYPLSITFPLNGVTRIKGNVDVFNIYLENTVIYCSTEFIRVIIAN